MAEWDGLIIGSLMVPFLLLPTPMELEHSYWPNQQRTRRQLQERIIHNYKYPHSLYNMYLCGKCLWLFFITSRIVVMWDLRLVLQTVRYFFKLLSSHCFLPLIYVPTSKPNALPGIALQPVATFTTFHVVPGRPIIGCYAQ